MDAAAEASLDLIRRAQVGDPVALEALIARYRPRLLRWASGRLPRYARTLADTEDLVQNTLIGAFKRIERIEIRDDGSLQAYLRQALMNAVRMEIRSAARRPAESALPDAAETTEASPLERAIGAETLARYERALDALRPHDRELVIAHVEFEFSHRELADAFGKPSANAARMALTRALMCLAEEMQRRPA